MSNSPVNANLGSITDWINQQRTSQNPMSPTEQYLPVQQTSQRWGSNPLSYPGMDAGQSLMSDWASGINDWRRKQGLLSPMPNAPMGDPSWSAAGPGGWQMNQNRAMPSFNMGGGGAPGGMNLPSWARAPINANTRQTLQPFGPSPTPDAPGGYGTPGTPSPLSFQQPTAQPAPANPYMAALQEVMRQVPGSGVTALQNGVGIRGYAGQGMPYAFQNTAQTAGNNVLSRFNYSARPSAPGFGMYTGGGYGTR